MTSDRVAVSITDYRDGYAKAGLSKLAILDPTSLRHYIVVRWRGRERMCE